MTGVGLRPTAPITVNEGDNIGITNAKVDGSLGLGGKRCQDQFSQ